LFASIGRPLELGSIVRVEQIDGEQSMLSASERRPDGAMAGELLASRSRSAGVGPNGSIFTLTRFRSTLAARAGRDLVGVM
jgi:hypothetical protein